MQPKDQRRQKSSDVLSSYGCGREQMLIEAWIRWNGIVYEDWKMFRPSDYRREIMSETLYVALTRSLVLTEKKGADIV